MQVVLEEGAVGLWGRCAARREARAPQLSGARGGAGLRAALKGVRSQAPQPPQLGLHNPAKWEVSPSRYGAGWRRGG